MGSLFIKTGLSPLYVIEMIIKFCVSLEFCVSRECRGSTSIFISSSYNVFNLFQLMTSINIIAA